MPHLLPRSAQGHLGKICKRKNFCLLEKLFLLCAQQKAKYEMDTVKIDSDTEFEDAEVTFDYIPMPFSRLADINESWSSKFVLVKVKIYEEDDPIKVLKNSNELDMQVKYVHDKEGSQIELKAWERFVSLLRVGKCYELSNVSVKVYKGIRRLSTNVGTSANEASFE